MAGSSGFAIQISATDHATAAIRTINKQLEALRAPAEHLHKEFNKLQELTGIKAVGEHIHKLGEHAREAGRQLSDIVRPLGIITGAASIAGIVELTTRWAEWGRELAHASNRINIAAPALHQWEGAARLAGASAGTMTTGLETLATTLHEMTWGRNTQAISYFTMLGFSMAEAKKYAGNVGAFLPILAERLSKISDPITRMAYAQQFLGGAAQQLFPLLSQGAAGIERYRKESERLYPSTKQNIEVAEHFAEAQSRISLSFSNLYETAIVKLAPGMTVFMDKMTDWFSQPETAQKFADAVEGIATAIVSIPWAPIGAGIKTIAEDIDLAVRSTVGWKVAIEGMVGGWLGKEVLGFLSPGGLIKKLLGKFLTTPLLAIPAAGVAASWAGGKAAEQAGPGSILGPEGQLTPMQPGEAAGPSVIPGPQAPIPGWQAGPGYLLHHVLPLMFAPLGASRSGAPSAMPPSVVGPNPTGTQSDPFYVKQADMAANPFGAGIGPGASPGQTMPGLQGFWGQANKLLSLSAAQQTVGREMHGWFMKQFGLTSEQAAGPIGNFIQESGLNPSTVATGGDTGLAQWTGGRKRRLFEIAGAMGMPWSSLPVQKAMILEELNTPKGRALIERMKHEKQTAPDWFRTYEQTNLNPEQSDPRRAAYEIPRREGFAERFLERVIGNQQDQQAPTAGPNGKAELHVTFGNAPAGTRARGQASGDVWSGAPRVEMPLAPAYGAIP